MLPENPSTRPSRLVASLLLASLGCTLLPLTAMGDPGAAAMSADAPSAPNAPSLPRTVAGKLAASYLEMFNSNSDTAAADWERANRTPARLKEAGVEERVKRIAKMRTDFGSLTLREVIESADDMVYLEVAGSIVKPIGLRFILDPKNPGKLDFVEVATGGPLDRPEQISHSVMASAVEDIAKTLEENYVFPETGNKMAAAIRQSARTGGYDNVKTDASLARTLTTDLQAISKDKHLRVGVLPPDQRSKDADEHGHDHMPFDEAKDNYGFRKVELLPGNIGYVKFDFFSGTPEAIPTITAAMGFVAHSDAIIFDLRQNGGGSPEAIRQITSFLFDQPTHLNDMLDREGKVVQEYWTLKDVAGPRIPAGVPVYVLTSNRTFSGGEEFTYNLKNLKRATIIGETTGGGAHPVRGERAGDRFIVRVPFMRANNPITKSNWEGVGVEPNIRVPADQALDRALEEARNAAHH